MRQFSIPPGRQLIRSTLTGNRRRPVKRSVTKSTVRSNIGKPPRALSQSVSPEGFSKNRVLNLC